MMKQYSINIKFYNYKAGEKVLVKRKTFKPGENRKIAPRKAGPWTIVEKMSNGVNFKVENGKECKILHHDRLIPFYSDSIPKKKMIISKGNKVYEKTPEAFPDYQFVDSSSDESDDNCNPVNINNPPTPERRYPLRERTQRNIEGTISWDVIDDNG